MEGRQDLKSLFNKIKAPFVPFVELEKQITHGDDSQEIGSGTFGQVYKIKLNRDLYSIGFYPVNLTQEGKSDGNSFNYAAKVPLCGEFQENDFEKLKQQIDEFIIVEKLAPVNEVIKLVGYSYQYSEKQKSIGLIVWILPLYESNLQNAITEIGIYKAIPLTIEEKLEISKKLVWIIANMQTPQEKFFHDDLQPSNILTDDRVSYFNIK